MTQNSQPKDLMSRFARSLAGLRKEGKRGDWIVVSSSVLIMLLIMGALIWLCWVLAIPALITWGFTELSWHAFFAAFAILYLAIIPLAPLVWLPSLISFWSEYTKERDALDRQVTKARDAQREIEKHLLKDDPFQLVRLLTYSRQILSEYYAIGTSQAHRSFFYSLVAMWLGFAVLIGGVIGRFLGVMTTGASEIVLLTGVVIEFIAAIFLWVYRHTIRQLTYFYSRQLKLHNTLLGYRLACDAGDRKAETIKLIVERLLEEGERPTIEAPSSSGITKLLSTGSSAGPGKAGATARS